MADFRREYQMTTAELAALSLPDFLLYLRGLSRNSRWAKAWNDKPKTLHDPADRAALVAAARR